MAVNPLDALTAYFAKREADVARHPTPTPWGIHKDAWNIRRQIRRNPEFAAQMQALYNQLGLKGQEKWNRQWELVNKKREKRGKSPLQQYEGELSLDDIQGMLPALASRSKKKAKFAEMLQQYVLQEKAEAAQEKATQTVSEARQQITESPLRREVMEKILANLSRPELITDKVQSMIESGISSAGAEARENFISQFGDVLSARNLPKGSGPGVTGVAGFEEGLAQVQGDQLRQARLDRILTNEDYRQRALAAAQAWSGMDADQQAQLAAIQAGFESGTPVIGLGNYGNWADFLANQEWASKIEGAGKPSATQGAIAGGVSGAATGTAVSPGWGTIIGALLGAGAGYYGARQS